MSDKGEGRTKPAVTPGKVPRPEVAAKPPGDTRTSTAPRGEDDVLPPLSSASAAELVEIARALPPSRLPWDEDVTIARDSPHEGHDDLTIARDSPHEGHEPRLPAFDAHPPPSDSTSKVLISVEPDARSLSRFHFGRSIAGTRAGIELGRPLFAVAVLGALLALAALLVASARAGQGVGVGALTATLNLWVFTRIGTGMLSRRGVRASWGVLAGVKLLALFVGVALLLRSDIADPLWFLVGYLSLPVGIVASQFLGLRPDFEEGERTV
jgi:ATP synthase I subunit